MYNTYFNFRESPFGVTPDPQLYYSNAVNREASATLHYGIEQRKGFILIAGEAGTGKTTLLRKALHSFGSNVETAYVSHTLVNGAELLDLILTDLGLSDYAQNSPAMIARLYDYSIAQFKNDRIVALLIDEAQDLSPECLEQLRLLGNLETDKQKLLQIVLVGQPELEQILDRHELRQLKQRIALRCRLEPVKSEEVGAYIDSRLRVVGRTSVELFDPRAIEKIARYSNGIPRLINMICDNALLIAYSMSKSKVSAEMIAEVARDLQLQSAPDQRQSEPKPGQPIEQQAALELSAAEEIDSKIGDEPPAPDAGNRVGNMRMGRIPFLPATVYSGHLRSAVAASLLLIALGVFLYSYLHEGAYSDPGTATVVKSTADSRKENDQTASAASAAVVTPDDNGASAEVISQSSSPPAQILAALATENKVSTVKPEKASVTAAVEPVITQSASLAPTVREAEQATPVTLDRKKETEVNTANFLVIGPSFVRAKPSHSAEIIDTLSPGTSINAGLAGEYYRIRSVGTHSIRGYVHKEDAFFERKK